MLDSSGNCVFVGGGAGSVLRVSSFSFSSFSSLVKYNVIELWVRGFLFLLFGETDLFFDDGVIFFFCFFLGHPLFHFARTTRKWRFIEFLSFTIGVVLGFLLFKHASMRFFHISTLSKGDLVKKCLASIDVLSIMW